MIVEESVPAPTSEVMPSVTAGIVAELWELLEKWYKIAANEAVAKGTQRNIIGER